jgi:hypothetical protein
MERSTERVIGSVFGLEQGLHGNERSPPFLKGREWLLVNARSGIKVLLQLLAPPRVWLPSYLCRSILQAIDGTAAQVSFFAVDEELQCSSSWLARVGKGDLVLLIDYFGFPCDEKCAGQAREQGAWVLEDASQALLSEGVGRNADFVVYSPRKFLGVPDGGILRLNRGLDDSRVDWQRPPGPWWLRTLRAVLLRHEFDSYGGSRQWFELFQQVESEAPIGPYSMSELSETLLRYSVDYPTVCRRRQENYRYLAEKLGNLALFPRLPADVVPLGFPIRLRDREPVRQRLFERRIYPPVHWPIAGIVPENFRDSHHLASEIMTLPCDQRYTVEDMDRIVTVLRGALES